ncbi:hypothetical protein COV18_01225 [Candidatus Woesearchaeota archaeon CG10_big_fil_rev_8_21_14_0_10_37_12]|nr:MAG: hypothetical protein COV18_01225 [Candidatus Woesearchaeota archaeon CG10_big_fil_rev_8_21_14_0_10_37_12]
MPQLLKKPETHSPTLDTILMVENVIKEAKEVLSMAELKRRLPRQVNHNTLKLVISYLQQSGKIEYTPNGMVWIFMPKEDIRAILSKGKQW